MGASYSYDYGLGTWDGAGDGAPDRREARGVSRSNVKIRQVREFLLPHVACTIGRARDLQLVNLP